MATENHAEPQPDLTEEEQKFVDFDESNLTDADAEALNATPAADAAAAVVDPAVPADPAPAADPADPAAALAPVVDAAPASAAPAAEPAAAPAPEPVAAAPQFLVIQPPADAAENLKQIAADKAALAEQFDAGDITAKEFHSQLDKLNEDKQAIDLAVNNAKLSAQMEQNRAQVAWDTSCNQFFKEPAASVYTDPKNFEAFNENVKAMASMPRNRGLSERQLLDKVDLITRIELGLPAAATTAAAPAQAAAAKPATPKPHVFPPNVGALPAADVTDTSGGQYAHLDRLGTTDPIAYEAALAKMSEVERDAYMKI